jgi:tRNA pseudouridine55 synthase
MNGILNINKPPGMTSHDVVNRVRRLTGERRVGHTGTLDPMAEGILPICIGKATRLIEYMDDPSDPAPKTYRVGLRLGISTDTGDIWGETLAESDVHPSAEAIESALLSFVGEQEQLPPAYSAIKYKGKKLYEYARKGQELPEGAKKPRRVFVRKIDILGIDEKKGEARFEVECSAGTYIRSICMDVGEMLGCGGSMYELLRIKSGIFRMEQSVRLDDFPCETDAAGDFLQNVLLPTDYSISHLPKENMTTEDAQRFCNGIRTNLGGESRNLPAAAPIRVYEGEELLGVGVTELSASGTLLLKPHKVLRT